MLTRLEVDGFKNLRDIAIEFGPFTCIAGENGAGKSNVFDAIEFLSLLASRSLMEAAQQLRSTRDDRSGDPRDLFWRGTGRGIAGDVAGNRGGGGQFIRLAAEMIVPHNGSTRLMGQAAHSGTLCLASLGVGTRLIGGATRESRFGLIHHGPTAGSRVL